MGLVWRSTETADSAGGAVVCQSPNPVTHVELGGAYEKSRRKHKERCCNHQRRGCQTHQDHLDFTRGVRYIHGMFLHRAFGVAAFCEQVAYNVDRLP